MIFEVGPLPCRYAWKPVDQNRGPGFEIRARFGRFPDVCYASWAFFSRDSSSPPGARKDSAPESRIFFPEEKEDSAPAPVFRSRFWRPIYEAFRSGFRRLAHCSRLNNCDRPRPESVRSAPNRALKHELTL